MADDPLAPLEHALDRAPLAPHELAAWRAAAGAERGRWLEAVPRLAERAWRPRDAELVRALARAILTLISRHPSIRAGHGVGHARRATIHAIAIAVADELGPQDAARAVLGAACHDLGRLILAEDSPALRHAEVSGVLASYLTPALEGLGEAIAWPVRAAVAIHTAPVVGETAPFRAVGDLRAADGLDTNGAGAALLRHLLSGATRAGTHARLPGPGVPAGSWLETWVGFARSAPPAISSDWPRLERALRGAQARRLIADWEGLSGDPGSVPSRLRALAVRHEPDTPPEQVELAVRGIAMLAPADQARWAGVLMRVEREAEAERDRLLDICAAALAREDDLLAPIAGDLLARLTSA